MDREQVKRLVERLREGVEWNEGSIADSLERASASMREAADALEALSTAWPPSREQIARALERYRWHTGLARAQGSKIPSDEWCEGLADAIRALKPEKEKPS